MSRQLLPPDLERENRESLRRWVATSAQVIAALIAMIRLFRNGL